VKFPVCLTSDILAESWSRGLGLNFGLTSNDFVSHVAARDSSAIGFNYLGFEWTRNPCFKPLSHLKFKMES
jgi:hypothetical protein